MIDLLKRYAGNRFELLKMEATEKGSLAAGSVTVYAAVAFFGFFFFILFNIGLGLWIGSLLGNYGYGVLIVSAFYLLVTIILLMSKKSIRDGVANKIIKSLNS